MSLSKQRVEVKVPRLAKKLWPISFLCKCFGGIYSSAKYVMHTVKEKIKETNVIQTFQPMWPYFHQHTVEFFLRLCFVVKTSADNVILQIFDISTNELSLFSIQLTLLRHRNSIELKKTQFVCENVKNL